MHFRWLGWAGVEIEHEGVTIVVDPLLEPKAVFAAAGDLAAGIKLPPVVSAGGSRQAVAGLVTHLHRDHADAGALSVALAEPAPVLLPAANEMSGSAEAGVRQARAELAAARLNLRPAVPWEEVQIGPFTVTALPAADGTGDPQVSWLIRVNGRSVVHCGDTLFHGWWWRIAETAASVDVAFLPINGAIVDFPWRQPPSPLPAVMTPEQAVIAALALGARHVVPMHYGAFDIEPFYRSIPDARERFLLAAAEAGVDATPLEVGAALTL
jgi:L-ascorbate metabolism protein UlaG (beta-lactamase superfamily)